MYGGDVAGLLQGRLTGVDLHILKIKVVSAVERSLSAEFLVDDLFHIFK